METPKNRRARWMRLANAAVPRPPAENRVTMRRRWQNMANAQVNPRAVRNVGIAGMGLRATQKRVGVANSPFRPPLHTMKAQSNARLLAMIRAAQEARNASRSRRSELRQKQIEVLTAVKERSQSKPPPAPRVAPSPAPPRPPRYVPPPAGAFAAALAAQQRAAAAAAAVESFKQSRRRSSSPLRFF
jgi:hypothetical protein